MKKNVAAIRSAGKTVGLICANIAVIYVHFRTGSHSGLLEPRHFRKSKIFTGIRVDEWQCNLIMDPKGFHFGTELAEAAVVLAFSSEGA